MTWAREAEFRELLARCCKKATKDSLEEIAALAVKEERQVRHRRSKEHRLAPGTCLHLCWAATPPFHCCPQGYKHISALLVRELKVLKPHYRLKCFYALSAIVRLSVKTLGAKDKYGERG